jgi:hypothetical protein
MARANYAVCVVVVRGSGPIGHAVLPGGAMIYRNSDTLFSGAKHE